MVLNPQIYVNLWIVIARIQEKSLWEALLPSASRKVVCLFGPRQVGKTTLLAALQDRLPGRQESLNGDYADDRALLVPERAALHRLAAHLDYLLIDEAQNVPEIGRVLKLLHDTFPTLRIVASGSSAFDLRQRTGEPLTGRQVVLDLFPISLGELAPSRTQLPARLEHGMIYGGYPEVLETADPVDKQRLLRQLCADYLLKDLFAQVELNRDRVHDLLRLLAFQIGLEVSLHELAAATRMDVKTVDRYLGLLEGAYVIRRLGGFSRNLRKEVAKSRKVYFLDLGIRNALVNAFQPPPFREDMGRLWENYLVIERHKHLVYERVPFGAWFWRTYDQQEIDYVEERDGGLFGYEFKWSAATRARLPKLWIETYVPRGTGIITPENVSDFLL